MDKTIGSLFAGVGGFDLGFERAGFRTVWQCEIDKAAQSVLRRRFPQAELFADVCQVGAENLKPVDVVTFGSPCFPAGVLVLTKRGLLPIEEVVVGDEVVSHLGRWQSVVRVGSKIAPTLRLKGQGHPGLVTTEEHPFWSSGVGRKWNNDLRQYRREFGPLEWTPAKDMKGRMWSSLTEFPAEAIPPMVMDRWETSCPAITPELMWVVGSWVGDGWVRDGKRPGRIDSNWGNVCIADGKGAPAAELRKRLAAAGLHFWEGDERTTTRFVISSAPFARWLTTHFGRYAEGKTIPAWLLGAPLEMREAFLQGFLFADGSKLKDKGYAMTSVSKRLTFGIAMLIRCTRGHAVSVYWTKAHEGRKIEGRLIKEQDSWQAHAYVESRSSLVIDGYRMGLVRECEATGVEERVYNIEVEGDHSYTADGIIVHNCQDLSVAGKRAGLAGGRSGLFHEAARVIRELRERYGKPDFAIWENVPGAFSSNEGRDFAAVVQTMVDLGARDIAWRVLDSQNFGVAQRRRRVFLVADFGGERAEQILFEPESLRGDIAPSGKKRKGAARGAAGGAGSGGGWPADVGATLNAAYGEKMGLEDQHALGGASLFVPTNGAIPFDTTQITSPSNYSRPAPGDPCHPLAAGAHPPAVAFAQNSRDEVRLVNGDGALVGALAAQPGMKQTSYVAMQPMTLAIRGRGDGAMLECRQDGLANTLMAPNGGRAGMNVGAVAIAPTTYGFDTTGSTIDEVEEGHPVLRGVSAGNAGHHTGVAIGFNWQNGGGYGNANDGLGITEEGTGPLQRCQTPAVCVTGEVTHALTSEGHDASEDGTGRGCPVVAIPASLRPCPVHDTLSAGGNSDADAAQADARQELCVLPEKDGAEDFFQRRAGVPASLRQKEVLRPEVHGRLIRCEACEGRTQSDDALSLKEDGSAGTVRNVLCPRCTGRSSHRRESSEQRAVQSDADLSKLSPEGALKTEAMSNLRTSVQGPRVLRHALPAVQEVGRSSEGQGQPVFARQDGDGTHPNKNLHCADVPKTAPCERLLRSAWTASAPRQVATCRRLVPVETERLQGFPDGWTAEGIDASGKVKAQADGPRYKQMGNAVTVSVAEWIARRLVAAMAME